MSQTGTIYGCHDGNTYSLANIYDEKLNEYNILAGTSAKNIISVSFNTETGVDYYFDSDVDTQKINFYQSSTQIASTSNASKPLTKIIPYLSVEHTDDYALKVNSSSKQYFIIGQPASYTTSYSGKVTPVTWVLIPSTKDAGGNYINSLHPSYEVEGTYFVDTSKLSKSGQTGSTIYTNPIMLYSMPATRNVNGTTSHVSPIVPIPTYGTNDTQVFLHMYSDNWNYYTHVRELDRNFFDEPFHFRLQWFNSIDNPDYVYLCYVNGELYFYKKRTANADNTLYRYYCWDHIVIGGYSQYDTSGTNRYKIQYFGNFHVKNFKVSLLSPVYQKITVPANILIRHNAANHYIPLTADAANTSAPYIAVRHGNTNFYTLK